MATFGNTLDAYALDPTTGLPLPGVELYAWADESGGTPLLSILSGLDGAFGWEYDTTADGQWVSAGLTGPRVYVPNNDALATRATTVYVDERLATKANAATVGTISAKVDTTETRVGTVEDDLAGRLSDTALSSTIAAQVAPIAPQGGARAVGKGELLLNVKDYGATGNGTTDDRAAIQATIDAANTAGGGVVFFPQGVYLVGSTGSAWNLKLKSKVTLRGTSRAAVTIRQKAGAVASERVLSSDTVGVSNVAIEALTIDGNGAAQSVNEHRHGVFLMNSSHVTVQDVEIYGMTGGGVSLYVGCTDITVQRCNIHDVARGAVELTGGDTYRIRVLNNTLSIPATNSGQVFDGEVENSGNGHADAVVIEGNSMTNLNNGYSLAAGVSNLAVRNAGWVITGNTFVGGVTLLGSTGARFTDNTVTVVSGTLPGVTASITTGTLVNGNTITTPTTAAAIVAEYTLGYTPTRLAITNNILNAGKDGVRLSGASQVRVAGNTMVGSGTASANGVNVFATTDMRDLTIENNTIVNFNQSAIDASPYSTSVIDGFVVRGNIFRDNQGTATMTRGVNLGGVGTQITNVDVQDNVAVNVATPYRDATTSGPVRLTRSPGGAFRETQGTAAPAAGTWAVGDRCWNTAPAASGTMGWVCTTAGTPGTWKTFGVISA